MARPALSGGHREGFDVDPVGLRALENGDVLQSGGGLLQGIEEVSDHGQVRLHLLLGLPALDHVVRQLVHRRVGDVGDVAHLAEDFLAAGGVGEVHRDVFGRADSGGLAARNRDDLPARESFEVTHRLESHQTRSPDDDDFSVTHEWSFPRVRQAAQSTRFAESDG